jgi:hypothetical protein
VLTSARCLIPLLETYIIVGVESINLEKFLDSKGQIRKIERIKLHEKFDYRLFEYDVALASFNEDLTFDGMHVLMISTVNF